MEKNKGELNIYIEKLVESFREGNDSKGCELVLIVIDKLEDILSNISKYSIEEEETWVNKLNSNLLEIVQALENKDYILLSDLFEYEIIPLLKDIKSDTQIN